MTESTAAAVRMILIAANRIRDLARGVTEDTFLNKRDGALEDAVILHVARAGNAASRLPDNFRALHPSVPWTHIIETGNIVVHRYWDTNLETVWSVATRDIQSVAKEMETAR